MITLTTTTGKTLGKFPGEHARQAVQAASRNGMGLARINLKDTDLSGINLCGVNLRYADLSGANLSKARLNGADLRHADLTAAILDEFCLEGAQLRSAIIDGVQTTREPIQVHTGIYPLWIFDRHMRVGCTTRTFAQWFDDMSEGEIAALNLRHAGDFSRVWRDALRLLVQRTRGWRSTRTRQGP